jgi:uncharacterized protein YqjF (DUF2071 family)
MRFPGWMRWRSPVFLHFRVAGDRLAPLLPRGVHLDTHQAGPWLSLLALEAVGPLPRFAAPVAGAVLRYRQVSLRTYVIGEEGPGVCVLETWTDRRLPALGARVLGVKHRRVRRIEITNDGPDVTVRARGLTFVGRATGVPALAPPGSLEELLLERRWLYARLPGGHPYALHVTYPPWRRQRLEWSRCELPQHPLLDGAEGPVLAELGQDQEMVLVEAVDEAAERSPLFLELETP